jgi:acetyl/propionyl-CoA carboxylase alpha subunit
MNTRIQVEHTVTELVTGLDLVREQVLIAAWGAAIAAPGRRPAGRTRDRVPDQRRGSVERLSAHSRADHELPGAGGPGHQVDSGVAAGSEVVGLYDPLIAKLVVHGVDREHARRRMLRALDEYEIGGVTTLLGFHRALLEHACFIAGQTCHGVVNRRSLPSELSSCLISKQP